MIFRIVDLDNTTQQIKITADTGEVMIVSSTQIASVLTQGHVCENAEIVYAGSNYALAISDNQHKVHVIKISGASTKLKRDMMSLIKQKGNRYIHEQPKQQQTAVRQAEARQAEARQAEARQAEARQAVKPSQKIDIRQKISGRGTSESQRIIYRGDTYTSAERLCAKFGCKDVERFKQLYAEGYAIDVCLGRKPMGVDKPVPRAKREAKLFDKKDNKWNTTDITNY